MSPLALLISLAVEKVNAAGSSSSARPKNFLLIAVDDLRPMFGSSYGYPEVLTPNMDKYFTNGGGSAMQHSYVQIAVCGPSRASILTGRRPDTTTVNDLSPGTQSNGWCWCKRGNCEKDALFMTLPTWFAQNGFLTSGNGKIYHPDSCGRLKKDFAHVNGDDYRAWNYGSYGVEGMLQEPFDNFTSQFSEEEFGTIPGPLMTEYKSWNEPWGPDWMRSPLSDEEQTDGQLATDAIERLGNFSSEGIGKGSGKPFFLATGFHKPHSPWVVPEKYFELYDVGNISLAPNPRVPVDFKEENWHANGNMEITKYMNPGVVKNPFDPSTFGFNSPVDNQTARELRHAYFAATSFVDAQIGRVMGALEANGYLDNTVVALWSDHGYHLGDTNSWCKQTNFEKATRNTLLWRVPGQTAASQGRNDRFVEMIDFFPTAIDLVGLPQIPPCTGLDQPPTVNCLQGKSYADEFLPSLGKASEPTKKQYVFSQWQYPAKDSPGEEGMRMAYTVRSQDGYRLTQYVPYDSTTFRGNWTDVGGSDDLELYDYNTDPDETTNYAASASHADVVKKLMGVLKSQFSPV